MPLSDAIPLNVLVVMSPEDLAGPLLRHLDQLERSKTQLHLANFSASIDSSYRDPAATRVVQEAWNLLEREGFLARSHEDWCFITRRGKAALRAESFESFRIASMLPKDILHPQLLPSVWGAFVRGQYDSAVFEACKEVEIAVREAGQFPDSLLGVDLMRKAFHPETGPLTDQTRQGAERQALSDLFAGTIGSYKNPNSHRRVKIEPKESVEIITLASHLLSIVDSRRSVEDSH